MATTGKTTRALTPTYELNLNAAGEVALRALIKARAQRGEHRRGEEGHRDAVLLEAALMGICALVEREGLSAELAHVVADMRAWLAKRVD